MELNITLVVQIVNFLIAWLLLHILCFKPAIQYMQMQQKASEQLFEAIAIWQGRIAQKEYDINAIWRDLEMFARHHNPDIRPITPLRIDYNDQNIHEYRAPSDDALMQTLQDIIVTGISDADL